MGEKENSPKWTGWMEAWWMSFSFRLSIYHSWFPGEYGWIRWSCQSCELLRSGLLTPSCVPFLQYWWSIAARISYQLATLARHWTRANVCSASMVKAVWCCALSCSNRKRQRDSWWMVAIEFLQACHTAASATKQSTQHKAWGVCQAQAFSAFNIAKETLFIGQTVCENGSSEENGSLTSVTGWHLPACVRFLQYLWSIWTGLLHECPIK